VSTPGTEAGAGSEERLPVDVQTRYERFPVSLKGAFVLRGADGNPHSVRIESARVARIPSGSAKPFAVEAGIVDVAPGRDLFVPFEAPVSEIEPGWYVVESTLKVDGGRAFVFSSRPFAVSWPRTDVRRGTIAVEKTIRAGTRDVRIDRVEMGGDTAAVVWWTESEGATVPAAERSGEERAELAAILIADGQPLDVLPVDVGRSGRADLRSRGENRTVSYPVPRPTRSLAVMMRFTSGGGSEPISLFLQ
jgi:hypothetical protein